jgi:signal peptidase I
MATRSQRVSTPALARDAITVFNYPVDRSQQFIKRIAGIPGDRIRISQKVLYRNGSPRNEPYAIHKTDYEDSWRDDFPSFPTTRLFPTAQEMLTHIVNGEVVVPPGKDFVLGGNRDQSFDSRYLTYVLDECSIPGIDCRYGKSRSPACRRQTLSS